MDNEDDEKRRVMTPPDSWSGGSKPETAAASDDDDSWLSDDELIPGVGDETPAAADPNEDVDASRTVTPVSQTAEDAPEDWLGAAPPVDDIESPASSPEDDQSDPVDDAMATAMEPPTPEPASAPQGREETPPRGSPTDAVGAAAAQLVAEELSADTPADSQTAETSEALLTDHKAAGGQQGGGAKRPYGVLAALVIGLLLLFGGGWGIMQERSTFQDTVRTLENELAAARVSAKGSLDTAEEQALMADNQALREQVASLREQYAGITSELDQMQAMIEAAQSSTTQPAASATAAAPSGNTASSNSAPADDSPESAPQAPATAVPVAGGDDWFVNVASYSRRDIAEEWALRLEGDVSSVQLQDVMVDGKALYRVRVVGFSDRNEAQQAARALETQYSIGPLWVGREAAGGSSTSGASADTGPKGPAEGQAFASAPSDSDSGFAGSVDNDGGWFIYVDTYSAGVDADSRARDIRDAGYDAKVAVESRQGELFYRVQVVGLQSQAEGEETVKAIAQLGDLPNLQLRKY